MSAAIALAAAGAAQGFADKQKQAAQQRAIADAKIEALQDQIAFQRLNASRRQRSIQGSGAVASGSRGIQFSGSIVGATNQAIFEDQFKTLENISQLKASQRLAALGGDVATTNIGIEQRENLISDVGTAVKDFRDTKAAENTNEELG